VTDSDDKQIPGSLRVVDGETEGIPTLPVTETKWVIEEVDVLGISTTAVEGGVIPQLVVETVEDCQERLPRQNHPKGRADCWHHDDVKHRSASLPRPTPGCA
jgi:hypothetical protein